jgi:selenocysteine-specific elongation factor
MGAAVRLRDEYMSIREWESLRLRARTALERFHEEWPLKRGMAKEELRTRLHQSPHRGKLVLEALAAEGLILEAGALVASPTHHGGIADRRAEADRVIEVLRERGLRPPWADELCAEAGCDREVLAALTEAGEVIRVTEDLYFAREVFDRFSHDILCLIDDRGPVTVAEVRDHFGISRKYALALLEHLDALRVTRRTGDNRARGSRAPASV